MPVAIIWIAALCGAAFALRIKTVGLLLGAGLAFIITACVLESAVAIITTYVMPACAVLAVLAVMHYTAVRASGDTLLGLVRELEADLVKAARATGQSEQQPKPRAKENISRSSKGSKTGKGRKQPSRALTRQQSLRRRMGSVDAQS